MMHHEQCLTFEEVLGISSLSGNVSQQRHSDTLGSWLDSIRGLPWIRQEAIFEASLCVLILGLRARSARETKDSGLHSHSWHIHWVQHINQVVLCIQSIGQDASPLLRCGIQ